MSSPLALSSLLPFVEVIGSLPKCVTVLSSMEKAKKRELVCKRAILHFSLCFLIGFFTGLAPKNRTAAFSRRAASHHSVAEVLEPPANPTKTNLSSNAVAVVTESIIKPPDVEPMLSKPAEHLNESTSDTVALPKLLIVISTTRANDPLQPASLTRLGHTLRLVPPPLLWLVAESGSDQEASSTAEVLRATGVMYRHLVSDSDEHFAADAGAEADRQRNLALNHVEQHRLDGVVHFAELSAAYDLRLFEEIRRTEVFGAWPVAVLVPNRKRAVVIGGPVCGGSTTHASVNRTNRGIGIANLAFNSSILWDPERWGRPSSTLAQDSIKFVQEVVQEDETKVMALPENCSRVLAWHVPIPRRTVSSSVQAVPSASKRHLNSYK